MGGCLIAAVDHSVISADQHRPAKRVQDASTDAQPAASIAPSSVVGVFDPISHHRSFCPWVAKGVGAEVALHPTCVSHRHERVWVAGDTGCAGAWRRRAWRRAWCGGGGGRCRAF